MGLIQEQWEFLKDVSKLIIKADELGYILTAGEMWRPNTQAWINSLPAETKLLALLPGNMKAEYGTPVGGVGIMKSKHCDRLAVDFNIFKKTDLTKLCPKDGCLPLGEYWESLNPKNRWGGNFVTRIDAPHFERNL